MDTDVDAFLLQHPRLADVAILMQAPSKTLDRNLKDTRTLIIQSESCFSRECLKAIRRRFKHGPKYHPATPQNNPNAKQFTNNHPCRTELLKNTRNPSEGFPTAPQSEKYVMTRAGRFRTCSRFVCATQAQWCPSSQNGVHCCLNQ